MNIFLKEIKLNIKSLIFWSIGLFLIVAMSMVKFEGLSGNVQATEELLKSFPKIVFAMFGMANLNIMKLSGYYGVIFFFVIVMGAIFSSNIGVKITANEINEKTSEFIFTKPVSRTYIILMKILSGLTMILLFCLVSFICSLLGIALLNVENTIMNEIVLLNISLFFTSIIYFGIGIYLGTINPKKGTIYSSLIFLATYLIAMIYDMIENNSIIQYFTPIKYFDVLKVINEGKISFIFICLSLIIGITFSVIGIIKIKKKDL